MERKHLKPGMKCQLTITKPITEEQKLNNEYIICSLDGLMKMADGSWKPVVEYYNLKNFGRFFRELNDFRSRFDVIELLPEDVAQDIIQSIIQIRKQRPNLLNTNTY